MKLLKNDFIRFLMAGGVNTLIGYSVTLLLFYAVGLNYALAQILQFILCFPIAYTLQSRFAFRAAWSLKRMFLYPLSSVPNWIIQIATVVLAVEIFRIEEYIAYLISYVVAIPVMFFVVRGIVRPAQKNKNVFTKGGFLRGYLLPYTVFFAGLFFLGFYDFFIEQHKTLIWSVDGLYQHYPFFVDTGRKMAALFSDPLSVSFFDVHYGLGEGVVSALGYYTLGDPIALITAWIGQATDFRTLYEVGIVLRYYLVGLSFLWYLKYLKIKPIAALAGSMVYVFNGHMVFWGIRHPFFINPAILLPLAYVGIEQIFRKRDSRLFVFSVFASAFSNFYFFYMNTIGMGLYALVRYFHYKRRKDVSMGWFVKTFSIRYLLGLMASSVLFLPMIKSFFDLSRDPGVAFDYGLYQK
ncbi:MAG TPA: hypothetical protein DHN33_05185, partial [Eubacteriaceae bacterium]|nr:hypothetical protein [Eubacteriaceae bacterium]